MQDLLEEIAERGRALTHRLDRARRAGWDIRWRRCRPRYGESALRNR
jgi:hypothetical protein